MPRIEFSHIAKRFEGEAGVAPTVALSGLDLTVEDREFLCLLGPSGCGKSTLLFITAGLERPSEGEVRVAGKTVTRPGRDRGMLFQQLALFPWLTARRNVEFGLELHGISAAERRARSGALLDLMGLAEFGERFPHQLSGGMQQRVAIARLLANEPEVLLMDEPFAALDAQTRVILAEEVTRIWQQFRRTVVFVTHSVDEAIFLADRVIVMTARPGRIKEEIRVDLPRPRDSASDEFNRIRRRVVFLLRDEVTRAALEQDRKGAAA
jgi:NitT/TauT family transport system ATP-binding protein